MSASQIVRSVMQAHGVCSEDFYGKCREFHLVEARIEAAKQLKAAKFSNGQIARFLQRHVDTVRYYIEGNIKVRKRERAMRSWPLKWLTPEVRQVVIETAFAEGTSPKVIIAQWAADRASYEVEARARAECREVAA